MFERAPGASDEDFWVVFDTSTKPDYYGDVHNLVALPKGEILRYDYRLELLSPPARDATFGKIPKPSRTLLIYGQHRGFRRGDPTPPEDTSPEDMLWVATRLAELALVFAEGGRAYFDLRLLDYPKQGEPLRQILDGLIARGEVPFRTWITLFGPSVAFERLVTGGSQQSDWEAIVDLLGTPPSQFAGDSFWRLREPVANLRALKRAEEQMERMEGSEQRVYQVKTRWRVREGQTCSIAVVSHTPKDAIEEAPVQRFVEISCADPLLTSSSPRVGLRRYTEETIKIRASRSELASPSTNSVRFSSAPARDTWPIGPNLTLDFLVEKSKSVVILGFILAMLAVVTGIIASQVDPLLWKVIWALLTAILGSASVFAFTGKLQLPKG